MSAVSHPREQGFTLVEMLVSLALFGLAASLLFGGIGLLARIPTGQATADTALASVASAQMVLRDRIDRLQPVVDVQRANGVIDVHGSASSFDFTADPVGRDAPDAAQHFRLIRTAAGDVTLYQLSSLVADIDPREPSIVGWTPVPLLRGTSALSISYFGALPDGNQTAWQSSWADRDRPPSLVRILVAFPSGDARRWPPLVIRPRATTGGCKIDPATGQCAVTA